LRVAVTERLLKSTPASIVAVLTAGTFLVVTRAAYINARIEALGSSITFLGYAVGVLCFLLCIVLICFYARNAKLLGIGAVACIILYSLLNKLDPVLIAYELSKNKYLTELAESTLPDPKFIVFKMKEGFGFPAGGAWEYIVFDASDEIGLSEKERTKDWEALHGGYLLGPEPECHVRVRHLEGHFFYLLRRC
jgi:hypothetical protein